ncbi:HalOD1 output domain-containing protein [Natronolimnobius baerhuensis]|uniref:Halobacterial output domain-containing protein n=1 Tax=Natronolimnobius baerhuensis TaxID=253108 RepID=A0A202EBE4_9EURY|nr:HalOD1 output domain-containing protein [Natronolimnobius baerhuensis]OVE85576.1 hypothetical protein B2G88_01760 [Natronolimnobius baerhuensis]
MDTTVSGVGVEALEYVRESGTVRTQFNHEKTPASMAVAPTLADLLGTDPVELDPCYSTVDPESLDALVEVPTGTNRDIHVVFTHEAHAIPVHSDGVGTITPEHKPTVKKYEEGAGR